MSIQRGISPDPDRIMWSAKGSPGFGPGEVERRLGVETSEGTSGGRGKGEGKGKGWRGEMVGAIAKPHSAPLHNDGGISVGKS